MSKIILELSDVQAMRLNNFILRSLDLMRREEKEIRELSMQAARHIGLEVLSAHIAAEADEYRGCIDISEDLYLQISRQEQMQEWIKGGKEQL